MIDQQVSPPRSGAPVKILLACCGCLTVLGVLSVVGIVVAFRSGSAAVTESKARAGAFLAALERHDFRLAKQMTSRQAKPTASEDKLNDIVSMMEKRNGKATGHSQQPGFYINTINGQTTVRLGYTMAFERGSTSVQMIMVREDNAWMVQSFNFQL